MGLTIHYSLSMPIETPINQIKEKLEALRQFCLDRPFKEVNKVIHVDEKTTADFFKKDNKARMLANQGNREAFEKLRQDPMFETLTYAGNYVNYTDSYYHGVESCESGLKAHYSLNVNPKQLVSLSVWTGEGCESADISLALYPKTVTIKSKYTGKNSRLKVEGSDKWYCSSFCKTQYASNPDCGGVENFVRCHLLVIAMLDKAKELGFEVDVKDEGGYWEKRDVKDLIIEIGEWNNFIAGFAGALKDAIGDTKDQLVSEIAKYPNFEHLEAQGCTNMSEQQKQVIELIKETAKLEKEIIK